MAAFDFVGAAYDDGAPGQFWSYLNYTVTMDSDTVTIALDDYGFEAAGGSGATVNATHTLKVNNASIWTRTQTYEKGQHHEDDLGNEKAIKRGSKNATATLAFSVKVGKSTQTQTANVSIPKKESGKTYKPTWKVTNLSISRSGNGFIANWRTPSAALDKNKDNHFNGFFVRWTPDYAGLAYSSEPYYDYREKDESATSASVTLAKLFKAGRNGLYPKGPVKLNGFRVKVRGYRHRNKGDKFYYGPWCTRAYYRYELPQKPTVGVAYDAGKLQATVAVESGEGSDAQERYDTVVRVGVEKWGGGAYATWTLLPYSSTSAVKYEKAFDLGPYVSSLAPGGSVRVTVAAYSRGIRGDSPTATASYTVSRVASATIKKISCSRKSASGIVTVEFAPGAGTVSVQLQRKVGSGGWSDVRDASGGGKTTVLYDSYGDASPSPGEYTWYRVKSSSDGFHIYSDEVRADCMYTAKPKVVCTATVGIVRVRPNADGTSALVTMGFTDSTPNSGCELSWSDRGNAWGSTSGPSTYQVTGKDSPSDSWYVGSPKYKATKGYTISGLVPGKTYYVRMRRYRTASGKTYYSKYTAVSSFVTESAKDDKCYILSIAPSKSGTSAKVVVAFKEDNSNTGTELSWSTSSGAWSSTTAPSTAVKKGKDSTAAAGGYTGTHTFALDGLTPGATYYVRARRYLEAGGATTYSPYSSRHSFSTESAKDDKCGIIAISPHAAGDGATLQIGYTEDNVNTGTEVQWAAYKNAWRSNEAPSSLLATWAGSAYSGGDWEKRQYVYLKGLDAGVTYYVKARRYLTKGSSTTRSPWSALHSFSTAKQTAANDECGIVSIESEGDGTGAALVVGYTEDNANTGTEVTWSDDKDAWTSSREPSKLLATWRDSTCKDPEHWKKTATVHLRGLELGTTYYVRARRYLADGGATTYSPYSKKVSVTTPDTAGDPDVRCGLVSLEPGGDGASAVAVVGWGGDRTGCEVSWAGDPDAWESSVEPSAKAFGWEDGSNKSGFKTADAEVDAGKDYYTRTGDGTDESPYVYNKVKSPKAANLGKYYELAWPHTATFHLHGLDDGVTVYVKARSYYEGPGGTVWSEYTGTSSVTPYSAPLSVSLFGPRSVARGEAVELYWVLEGELEQAEWHVREEGRPRASLANGAGTLCRATIPPDAYGDAKSLSVYVSAGYGGALTDSNAVTVGVADAPSCELWCPATCDAQPLGLEAYTDDPAARLLVTCRSCGVVREAPGGDATQVEGTVVWTDSLTPTWREAVWADTRLRAELAEAAAAAREAREAASGALAYVASGDAEADTSKVYYLPDGGGYSAVGDYFAYAVSDDAEPQDGIAYFTLSGGAYEAFDGNAFEAGEAYYTRQLRSPAGEGWYEAAADAALALSDADAALASAEAALAAHPSDGACYVAQVSVPQGTDFVDNGKYALAASTVDSVAGLSSGEASRGFSVAWSHQAPVPGEGVTVLSDVAQRKTTIALDPPEDAAEGDVYDVYRKTPDGFDLIARDLALDAAIDDDYAPFGPDADLFYRVCCRTADGDEGWEDYPYSLPVSLLRVDWPGGFAELPYNQRLSDGYEKSFEARSHADGSVNGYFDKPVKMTGRYRVDVERDGDLAQVDSLRSVGDHPGECFVRTGLGMAFQCDCELDELTTEYGAPLSASASLSVAKVKLGDQFMATLSRAEDADEGEEAGQDG